MPVSRRTLIIGGVAGGAAAAALPGTAASASGGPLRTDPFTLGVASGDPDHDGVVLWTRLAPQPLATPARRR